MLVAGLMDASVFLGAVEGPVGGEVAVGAQGAQLEDGLGALEAPAGAGDVEPVAGQVPAGAFDHAGGDRPAGRHCGVVAEELPLGGEVADAGVDAAALLGSELGIAGLLAERGDDGVDVAGQDAYGVGGDPGFGGRVAVLVEAPGRLPAVLEDVDEVDQDVDRHLAACRLRAEQVELVAGAIDQHDPGAATGRVPLLGLVEHARDDLLAGGGDRAGQPLGGGDRARAARPTTSTVIGVEGDGRGEDIVGSAGGGGGVVDDPQGRHPLAALLLAAGQPGPVGASSLDGGGLAGLVPQRLVGGRLRRDRLVEGVDVGGGRHGELLDLPFPGHVAARWVIAVWALSKEPRTASTAALRCNPCECSRSGRFRCASAGYRLRAPSARQAQRVTRTVPNTVARWRVWPGSTLRWTMPPASMTGLMRPWATACRSRRARRSRWSWNSSRSTSRPLRSRCSSTWSWVQPPASALPSVATRASNAARAAPKASWDSSDSREASS